MSRSRTIVIVSVVLICAAVLLSRLGAGPDAPAAPDRPAAESASAAPTKRADDPPSKRAGRPADATVGVVDGREGAPAGAPPRSIGLTAFVTDESDAPVPGASVWIEETTGAATRPDRRIAVSGPDGVATFRMTGPGRVTAGCRHASYCAPQPVSAFVGEGRPTSVRFRLLEGRLVRGRTIDSATSAPVAGCAVHCSGREEPVRSDADGDFVVPLPVGEAATLAAWTDEHEPAIQDVGPADATVVLRLTRAVELVGRVVDARRRPVAGATVTTGCQLNGLFPPCGRRVESGIDGKFRIHGFPRGPHALFARVEPRGVATATYSDDRGVDPIDLGDVVVGAGTRLSGRVLRADGRPFVGASVMAEGPLPEATPRRGSPYPLGLTVTTRSGDDGSFAFDGLIPERTYLVAASIAGAPQVVVRDYRTPSAEEAVLDLVVAGRCETRLRLVDARGNGVRGVPVRATAVSRVPQGGSAVTGVTDAAGRLAFDGLPESELRLELLLDGSGFLAPPLDPISTSAACETTIALIDAATVSGRLGFENGLVGAGLHLRALRSGSSDVIGGCWADEAGRFSCDVRADAGAVDLEVDGQRLVKAGSGVSVAQTDATGSAHGLTDFTRDVEIRVGAARPDDGPLSVHVADSEDHGVQGVEVVLDCGSDEVKKTTDDAGDATFTTRRTGPAKLRFWCGRLVGAPKPLDVPPAAMDVPFGAARVVASYRRGRRLDGEVVDDRGAPVPGALVRVSPLDGATYVVRTNARGEFVAGLVDGGSTIEAEASVDGGVARGEWSGSGQEAHAAKIVLVRRDK